MFIIFPTVYIILSAFFADIVLPMAFPNTVNEATNAPNNKLVSIEFSENICENFTASIALTAPDITPQTSPITSLHTLDTLSDYFDNLIASFAPFLFFAAIE